MYRIIQPALLLAEPFRLVYRMVKTAMDADTIEQIPRGDGRPIIFYPGLGMGNGSTLPLRSAMSSNHHNTYAWSCNTNKGFQDDTVDTLIAQVEEIREETGQKVTLVGQSLGGTIARAVAFATDSVEMVITLGTPIRTNQGVVGYVLDKLHDATGYNGLWPVWAQMAVSDLDIPCISIFSETDGVVDPFYSALPPTPYNQNVIVSTSHLGMALSLEVAAIISQKCSTDNK